MSVKEVARLTAEVRSSQADPRQLCEATLSKAANATAIFSELGTRAEADAEALVHLRGHERSEALVAVPIALKDGFAVSGIPQHLGLGLSLATMTRPP